MESIPEPQITLDKNFDETGLFLIGYSSGEDKTFLKKTRIGCLVSLKTLLDSSTLKKVSVELKKAVTEAKEAYKYELSGF